jgi:hypothetical protein
MPGILVASTDLAHGPRLCAPGAGADTILISGVKMGALLRHAEEVQHVPHFSRVEKNMVHSSENNF